MLARAVSYMDKVNHVSMELLTKSLLPWFIAVLIPSIVIDILLIIKFCNKKYTTIVFIGYLVINLVLYKLLVFGSYTYLKDLLSQKSVTLGEKLILYEERIIIAPEVGSEKTEPVYRVYEPQWITQIEEKDNQIILHGEIEVYYYLKDQTLYYTSQVEKMTIPGYLENHEQTLKVAEKIKREGRD